MSSEVDFDYVSVSEDLVGKGIGAGYFKLFRICHV